MIDRISYSKIVEEFGEKKIHDRYVFLHEKMQRFIQLKSIQDMVYVNTSLLEQVILDYFTDIYRLKKFHGIEKVNESKIFSYETYWILRRKPLQLSDNKNDKLKFVNEDFLTMLLAHEFLSPDNISITESNEKKFLELVKHISYHLRYRNVDKQSIELIILSFLTAKEIYSEKILVSE